MNSENMTRVPLKRKGLPSILRVARCFHGCRETRDLCHAQHLHVLACEHGLECYQPFCNRILSMLTDTGNLSRAQQVFDKMVMWNDGSWNSLITGYAMIGDSETTLNIYHKMKHDAFCPSPSNFVLLLQACRKLKNIETGHKIYADIASSGLLEKNIFLRSTLVDMYAKSGAITIAEEVFNWLPEQNITSWNALMGGYNKSGLGSDSLNCFKRMKLECVPPNTVTFLCSLQACCSSKIKNTGQQIHVEASEKGIDGELLISSTLVDMYAKTCSAMKAHNVFEKIAFRSTITWNTLIAGYAKQGPSEDALKCFNQMQLEGILPDDITYTYCLNACSDAGLACRGHLLHAAIAASGFLKKDAAGNSLINMYAKCGLFEMAKEVFDELPFHDTISWNALLAGVVCNGLDEEILRFIDTMQCEEISPDAITFVYSLKTCGNQGTVDKGRILHTEVVTRGFLDDQHVGNALVDMYTKCGLLHEAHAVFDRLPQHNIVSWTALIGGYAEMGCEEQALRCFDQMQLEGINPNNVSFLCSLKACSELRSANKGQEMHVEISRRGLLENDVVVGSSLVDMYAKCGMIAKAEETFILLPDHDVVSWNAIITGCVQQNYSEKALDYFVTMQLKGVSPNSITYICCLKACYVTGNISRGLEIHAEAARNDLFKNDILVCNALINMYAECGFLQKAEEVFAKLSERDMISWTTIIFAYAKHEHGEKALNSFKHMQLEGISPTIATFLAALKACCHTAALGKALEMHSQMTKQGFEEGLRVGSTLVIMYVTNGLLLEAQDVFEKLRLQDVVSWNALIAGYVQVGDSENVFETLDRMKAEGRNPDLVTFISVLHACSQGGLLEKGHMYFDVMLEDYGVDPSEEHQACMIDLFARVGEMENFMGMLFKPNSLIWNSVLSACRNWGNMELGQRVFLSGTHLKGKNG